VYNTSVIPPLTASGTLPPGIHDADDWTEVVQRFGGTPKRAELLGKLRLGLDNLRDAGCPWVLLDGSFVTSKPNPNDVDGCWEDTPEIDLTLLDPSFLLQQRSDRDALKQQYGMDFFVAGLIEAGSGKPFFQFFQVNREGVPKGIVRLDLAVERDGGGERSGEWGDRE
jgi:Family of unknown function (DUF6932)